MRHITKLAAAALLPVAASLAAAQTTATPPSTSFSTVTARSTILGERRSYRVALPSDYGTSSRHYPVLLILDADDDPQFRAALTSVAFLASREAIPPMIVVGVQNGPNRTRDLTPDSLTPAFLGEVGGGAERFLDYLEQEVMPAVRARYRTAPFTVFAGHSLGGLLGVHVAGTRAGLAHAIIAMSPSLWVNKEAATPRFVRAIAGRNGPLHLFTTRGRYEPGIDSSTARFESSLSIALSAQGNSAIRYGHTRYTADSHGLTPISSLLDGLRFVFADYSRAVTGFDALPEPSTIDSTALLKAARATEAVYIRARRTFPPTLIGGDTAAPNAPSVAEQIGMAPFFMLLGQHGAALEYYNAARQVYPKEPRLRQTLGDVYLAKGDTARAIGEYEAALTMAGSPPYADVHRAIRRTLAPLRAKPATKSRRR